MSGHCLVVTQLTLHEADKLAIGVSARLGMLVQGVREAGASVRLFCTVPENARGGSGEEQSRRIEGLLAKAWNVEVEVVAHPRESTSPWMPWLASQLIGVVRPQTVKGAFSRRLMQALDAELARSPSFILAHRLPAMIALQALGRPLPRVYFDLDDLTHRIIWRRLPLPGALREKIFDAATIPAVILAERRTMRAATRTFVCSSSDAVAANKLSGKRNAAVIPNAVALRPVAARPSGAVMLMVGIYSYEPNADGADFFVSEILPLIRERRPDAELWLVGASPESIPSFARKPAGVRFLGFVDDLPAAYAQARLVVCPIRFGGGTRVKLVEAAAYAKAIVSTTIGAEGLGMVSGRHALLADRTRDFADACLKLMEEDTLVDRLGTSARELAAASHDKARIVARLAQEFKSGATAP